MSDPFLSEIRLMSFNYPPKGWALCNGALLAINQNQALFTLLGTNYGGDGRQNFALPNLQGRTPIHRGAGYTLGQIAGEQNHTLSSGEMPAHTHIASASSAPATATVPGNTLVLAQSQFEIYRAPSSGSAMSQGTIGSYGGSQPHTNMQPFLTISFCIALQGIYPSQN